MTEEKKTGGPRTKLGGEQIRIVREGPGGICIRSEIGSQESWRSPQEVCLKLCLTVLLPGH